MKKQQQYARLWTLGRSTTGGHNEMSEYQALLAQLVLSHHTATESELQHTLRVMTLERFVRHWTADKRAPFFPIGSTKAILSYKRAIKAHSETQKHIHHETEKHH